MICPLSEKELAEFVDKLISAAQGAGVPIRLDQVRAEILPAPHRQPKNLPPGKQAIYWFCLGSRTLKVGRVGPKSGPRYTSQHYNSKSSQSNLAKSVLKNRTIVQALAPPDCEKLLRNVSDGTVGDWIKHSTTRINLILDSNLTDRTVSFLESLIHQWLNPVFEGRLRRVSDVDGPNGATQGQN
ncbi:MAG: hypothetical protein SFV51_32360, partial [Bryobacteraceae bacterium]|nr:hypothetical protein [Bryobacteraceae bacterium]